jgi:hypothetical protein
MGSCQQRTRLDNFTYTCVLCILSMAPTYCNFPHLQLVVPLVYIQKPFWQEPTFPYAACIGSNQAPTTFATVFESLHEWLFHFTAKPHNLTAASTDTKENHIFLIYKEIQSGAFAKSNMTNGLLIYIWGNIWTFPHILGSPSSYTLQRKSHLCIPFLRIARPQPQFLYIHVSASDLYSPRIGLHISSCRIGRPIVGIYKSLTDA